MPSTGINADLVQAFDETVVDTGGCRPMGIDTTIWSPSNVQTANELGFFNAFPSELEEWADTEPGEVTRFEDGSLYAVIVYSEDLAFPDIVPGLRLVLEIPTNDPDVSCNYVWGPLADEAEVALVVSSIRWIEGH